MTVCLTLIMISNFLIAFNLIIRIVRGLVVVDEHLQDWVRKKQKLSYFVKSTLQPFSVFYMNINFFTNIVVALLCWDLDFGRLTDLSHLCVQTFDFLTVLFETLNRLSPLSIPFNFTFFILAVNILTLAFPTIISCHWIFVTFLLKHFRHFFKLVISMITENSHQFMKSLIFCLKSLIISIDTFRQHICNLKFCSFESTDLFYRSTKNLDRGTTKWFVWLNNFDILHLCGNFFCELFFG